jgi:hypothetical protein
MLVLIIGARKYILLGLMTNTTILLSFSRYVTASEKYYYSRRSQSQQEPRGIVGPNPSTEDRQSLRGPHRQSD